MNSLNNKTFLVTGASGFVGKALTRKLLTLGATVHTFSRTNPEISNTTHHSGDISDQTINWDIVLKNIDGIFHVASKVAMWGPWKEFYNTNVLGTKKLLEAAKKNNVKAFVYTSSPSVIADGTNLRGINESYPYPVKFLAHYPHTKSIAEKYVLDSNSDSLKTLALRPHLIFGPGDTSLTKHILDAAKSGRLKKIGDGNNLVDFTYIEDCVQAHLCGMNALFENAVNASGRAFFISQGEPYPFWKWVEKTCLKNNVKPPTISVPVGGAKFIGSVLEWVWNSARLKGEPPLTKFLACELGTDHYFDISAARNLLGYKPKYRIDDVI